MGGDPARFVQFLGKERYSRKCLSTRVFSERLICRYVEQVICRYFSFVRSEKLFIPSENSLEDRKSFHGQLAREIKKKLWSGQREDPDINIDLNVDQDVFMEGLGSVLPGVLQRGKMVYQLESNRVLDSYLGLKQDERILNVAEDFAYVIPGTIKYWLGQRSPIIEYKLIVVGVLKPFHNLLPSGTKL